jgi:hypothetical protein
MPFARDYRKLAANPDGFPALVEKLIALEKEPMAWGEQVKAMKTPVLIIAGDAEEHVSVEEAREIACSPKNA